MTVQAGADLRIALHRSIEASKGAKDCVRRALAVCIPVRLVEDEHAIPTNILKGHFENPVPCQSARVPLKRTLAGNVRGMEGLGMRRWVGSTLFPAVLLAFGLVQGSAFGQGVHLDALREWLRNTEEAANFVEKREYAKAEQRLTQAIKEIRPYFPETQRMLARSYCELARVLYHQKRYAEAEPLARWALSVRESDTKAKPDAVFQCVYTLGLIQSAQKHLDEAEKLLKRSLTLQDTNLGEDHINSTVVVNQLAQVYIEQAKYVDAEALYRRSIAIHERTTPDENLDLAATADLYAVLLRRMSRDDEAKRWHARALAIRDNVATKSAKAKADRAEKNFRGFN